MNSVTFIRRCIWEENDPELRFLIDRGGRRQAKNWIAIKIETNLNHLVLDLWRHGGHQTHAFLGNLCPDSDFYHGQHCCCGRYVGDLSGKESNESSVCEKMTCVRKVAPSLCISLFGQSRDLWPFMRQLWQTIPAERRKKREEGRKWGQT